MLGLISYSKLDEEFWIKKNYFISEKIIEAIFKKEYVLIK